jgi:hypothetical protein
MQSFSHINAFAHTPLLQEPKKARLWGGRFRTDTDPVMEKFNNSINFDKRMWAQVSNANACTNARTRSDCLLEHVRSFCTSIETSSCSAAASTETCAADVCHGGLIYRHCWAAILAAAASASVVEQQPRVL